MELPPDALVTERLPDRCFRRYPKATWAPGPWHDEPDRVEWRECGLPALALRGPYGAWNGYVGVARGHPWFELSYHEVYEATGGGGPDVHGGELTFAGSLGIEDPFTINHHPRPGEPVHIWWLGFDCNHAFDQAPGMEALLRAIGDPAELAYASQDVYRDLDYVVGQVRALAAQVAAALGAGR